MRTGYWDELAACGDTFTCYSAALAAWTATGDAAWAATLRSGLHLVLTEEGGGLFGFSHFPPGLAATLGLKRRGSDDAAGAVGAIRAELQTHGRVIISGDGFRLPWHVACGRRHVPHWFTLVADPGGAALVDPFECRTELGWQRPTRRALPWEELESVVVGLPGDDPVLTLREAFALGDDDRPLPGQRSAWLSAGARTGAASRPALGTAGPEALRRLARHFRENGSRPDAYRQADDLWSVARHRAFFARQAGDPSWAGWVAEHLVPLAARWAHIAPLLMQARLGVEAGRSPSSSLPEALVELAERESLAAACGPNHR